MLHYYAVYALVDCGYCAKAISKLAALGLDHVLVLMDKNILLLRSCATNTHVVMQQQQQ